MSDKRICVPGDQLFEADPQLYQAGAGTYIVHGQIFASLAGFLHLTPKIGEEPQTVEICPSSTSLGSKFLVPEIGAVVTGWIDSITPRFAKVSILSVENSVLAQPFAGQIRKEDVREKEKDKVAMQDCFRPGDTVLARVLGLGDTQSSYLLSTAEQELGVVCGRCMDGHKMTPGSWSELECVKCEVKMLREVAKIPHFTSEIAAEKSE